MMDISVLWQLFRRRLPMVLGLAILGAAAGIWTAMSLPAVYTSQAVLVVQSRQMPDELAPTTVRTGEIEALQIIRQRILSREVLLQLSNDLNLYDGRNVVGADARVFDLRERIAITTEGGPSARRGPRDATIVKVRFRAGTPHQAVGTVNALVALILQTNVDMRTSVARQTLDFFNREVARYETDLSQLSADIRQFQEENLNALPDSLGFRRDRQARLEERLDQLNQDQTALYDQRAKLVTLFEATGTTEIDTARRRIEEAPPRAQLRPAEQRLAELRGEYASLVAVLSDNNPRITLLRTQIDAAQDLVSDLPPVEAGLMSADAAQEQAASVYGIQLAELDAQIAAFEAQKSTAQSQIAALHASIEATPGNAVTLAQLQRSYDALLEQYNQAVASKSRAEAGSIIESLSHSQRISVVEQAVPPENPTSPHRPLVSMAGLSIGLFLATAIVGLLELLNKTVRRAEDLETALGVQPFATIPYITTRQEAVRNGLRRTTLTAVIVTALAVSIWYVDQYLVPLQPLFERLLAAVSLI